MKIALPISHLINHNNCKQIPVDLYEFRDRQGIPKIIENSPAVWHSSLGHMKYEFLFQFNNWNKIWGNKIPLYSCTLGPAVQDYRIEGKFYQSIGGNNPMGKEDIYCWTMAVIWQMKDVYKGKIAFENTNGYTRPEYSHVTDPEFIATLIRESDTYMILDLAHIMVSCYYNRKFSFLEYVKRLPLERVVGVHLSAAGRYDYHNPPNTVTLALFKMIRNLLPEDIYVAIEYYKNFNLLKECYYRLREVVAYE